VSSPSRTLSLSHIFLGLKTYGYEWKVFATKRITAKFKVLRKELKQWAKSLSSLKDEIEECNSVIALLDSVENFRSLIPSEVALRASLKQHLTHLLKQELAYWKQRGKIKWVNLGDLNSKFFHSLDTVQKRKNHIASLTHFDGTTTSSREGKAALLLDSYKERLGQTTPTSNSFDMASLLASYVDLSFFEEPITSKVIDDVVKDFPNNKSPGPDGFNA
jgi:hypothetical protein